MLVFTNKNIPIWIYDSNIGKYIEGYIQSPSSDSVSFIDATIEDKASNEMVDVHFSNTTSPIKVSKRNVQLKNPEKYEYPLDLANLTFLNEASIIHTLIHRYSNDMIYTYSGIFLISINPYKIIPSLYSENLVGYYSSITSDPHKQQPHIFAVAASAYNNLKEFKVNQSILVTGESGSGKTENTKKLIQFFALKNGASKDSIETLINQTNPILESFGNAKTLRNDNSSRFGKYIRLQFSEPGHLVGAHIDCYLLEKSRVTHHNSGERSFHIFYQLIYGAPSSLLESLFLTSNIENYHLLTPFEHTDSSIQRDITNFNDLMSAFKALDISYEEYIFYFKCIAAILHLGNVQISCLPNNENEKYIIDQKPLDYICSLLGLYSTEHLISSILKPNITAGRDVVVKGLSSEQITESLGTFMRALYERSFNAVISRLNYIFFKQEHSNRFIGLLDMAGFEVFEKNSFEQLCINYTNEKLQQFFNQHMFQHEQLEYKNEGIDWSFIDYGLDLQPTIDLLEKSSPAGIFALLDEECVLPMTSDASFTEKVITSWKGKSSKFEHHRFSSHKGFSLVHYAGKVQYYTDGWISKNKDPINETLSSLMTTSKIEFFRLLFSDFQAKSEVSVGGCFFKTLLQKYKEQLNFLLINLNSSTPHFVRCIVPNNTKSPISINQTYVLEQLRCNGVLEGIRICRNGYPNRLSFLDFRRNYFILSKACIANMSRHDDRTLSKMILDEFKSILPENSFQIGKSKILFKAGVLALLESYRDNVICSTISVFQAISFSLLCVQKLSAKSETSKAISLISSYVKEVNDFYNWPWWKVISSIRPLLESKKLEQQSRINDEQIHLLQLEKRDLLDKLTNLQVEFSTIQSENEELKDSLILKDQSIKSALDSIFESNIESQTLTDYQKTKDQEILLLNELVAELKGSEDTLRNQNKENKLELEALKETISSLSLSINVVQNENILLCDNLKSTEEKVETSSAMASLLEIKNNELVQKLKGNENEMDSLKSQNSRLSSSLQNHEVQIGQLKNELESSTKRNEEHRSELLSQLEEYKAKYSNTLTQLRSENTLLTKKLFDSEKTVREQNELIQVNCSVRRETDFEGKESEFKHLTEKFTSLSENYANSQQIIFDLKSKIFNLDTQLIKNGGAYLQNISELEATNYKLSVEKDALNHETLELKEQNAKLTEKLGIIDHTLLETQAVFQALKDDNEGYQKQITALSDSLEESFSNLQKVNASYTVIEKKLELENQYRHNIQTELKESSLKNAELESQLFSYKIQLSDLQKKNDSGINSSQKTIDSLEKKISNLNSTLISLQEKNRQSENEKSALFEENQSRQSEFSSLKITISDLQSRLEYTTINFESLKNECLLLSNTISSLETEKEKLQDVIKVSQNEQDQQIANYQTKVDSKDTELKLIKVQNSKLEIKLADSQHKLQETCSQFKLLEDDHKQALDLAFEKENQLQASLQIAIEKIANFEREKSSALELVGKLKTREEELDNLKDSILTLELQIHQIQSEKDILQASLECTERELENSRSLYNSSLERVKESETNINALSIKLRQQEKIFDKNLSDKLYELSQEHIKEKDILKTEFNEKVSIIRSELSASLASVITSKAETEKNLKHLQYEVKMKDQSISILNDEIASLKLKSVSLSEKILDVEALLTQGKIQSASLLKEISEKEKFLILKEELIESLITEKSSLTETVSNLTQFKLNSETQLEENTYAILNLNSLVENLEHHCSKLSSFSNELSRENLSLKEELLSADQMNTHSLAEANDNISSYLGLLAETEENLQIKTEENGLLHDQLAQEKLSNNLMVSDLNHLKSKLQSQEVANSELAFSLKNVQHELRSLSEKFAFQSQNLEELKSIIVSKSVQLEDQNLVVSRQKNLIKELEETNKFLSLSLSGTTNDLDTVISEKSAINISYLELEQKLFSLKKDYDSLTSEFEIEKRMKDDRINIVNNLKNHNQSLENMLIVERSRVKDLENDKVNLDFINNELKCKLRIIESDAVSSETSKEDEDEIYQTLFSTNSPSRTPSVLSLSSGRRSIVSTLYRQSPSTVHLTESITSLAKSPVYLTLRKQLEGFRQTISSLSKEKSDLLVTCQELQKKISQLQLNSEKSFAYSSSSFAQDVLKKPDNNLITNNVKNDKYFILSPSSPQLVQLPTPLSVPNLTTELPKPFINTNDDYVTNEFQ